MSELNAEAWGWGWGTWEVEKRHRVESGWHVPRKEGSQGERGVRSGSDLNACLRSLAFVFPCEQWSKQRSGGGDRCVF